MSFMFCVINYELQLYTRFTTECIPETQPVLLGNSVDLHQ